MEYLLGAVALRKTQKRGGGFKWESPHETLFCGIIGYAAIVCEWEVGQTFKTNHLFVTHQFLPAAATIAWEKDLEQFFHM